MSPAATIAEKDGRGLATSRLPSCGSDENLNAVFAKIIKVLRGRVARSLIAGELAAHSGHSSQLVFDAYDRNAQFLSNN